MGDYLPSSSFVTVMAVPEPGTIGSCSQASPSRSASPASGSLNPPSDEDDRTPDG
jgi:hypothetical protein